MIVDELKTTLAGVETERNSLLLALESAMKDLKVIAAEGQTHTRHMLARELTARTYTAMLTAQNVRLGLSV